MPSTVQPSSACAVPKVRQTVAAADHAQGLQGAVSAEVESSVAAQGRVVHDSQSSVQIGDARVTRTTLQADSFAAVFARIQNPDAVCSIQNEAAFVGRHTLAQDFEAHVAAQTRAELVAAAGVTLAKGAVDVQPLQPPAPQASCAAPAQRPTQAPASEQRRQSNRFTSFEIVSVAK